MDGTKLSNRIVHEQSLTQSQQFFLSILQMNQQELRDLIIEELQSNPLLEEVEEQPRQAKAGESVILIESDSLVRSDQSSDYDFEAILNQNRQTVSFQEYVQSQIDTIKVSEELRRILYYLVNCLDRKGYLTVTEGEVAVACHADRTTVRKAVSVLQSLDPVGVGARNLQECLLIQLKRKDQVDECIESIIHSGLALVADNRMEQLSKETGFELQQIKNACKIIKQMNPIPSQGYDTGERIEAVIPEATISFQDNEYTIQLNDTVLPKVQLDHYYQTLCKNKNLSKEDLEYLKKNKERACNLVTGIQKRNQTLLLLLKELVKAQPGFFMNGSKLRPLSMTQVAGSLNVNPSTISRAVRGKYVQCSRGAVPLRMLFQTGHETTDEREAVSTSEICTEIRTIISKESKGKPLSDQKISEALREKGIVIARRTVMKYRDRMKIPCSFDRKET